MKVSPVKLAHMLTGSQSHTVWPCWIFDFACLSNASSIMFVPVPLLRLVVVIVLQLLLIS